MKRLKHDSKKSKNASIFPAAWTPVAQGFPRKSKNASIFAAAWTPVRRRRLSEQPGCWMPPLRLWWPARTPPFIQAGEAVVTSTNASIDVQAGEASGMHPWLNTAVGISSVSDDTLTKRYGLGDRWAPAPRSHTHLYAAIMNSHCTYQHHDLLQWLRARLLWNCLDEHEWSRDRYEYSDGTGVARGPSRLSSESTS